MFDPTRDKLDRDFDESMRMFEKALVGPVDPIEPLQPAKVLIAIDGSSQDAAVVEAASLCQKRFTSKILILDGREAGEGEELSNEGIQQGSAIEGAELLSKGEGATYDRIIEAVQKYEPDLVIVPCPFGRDFESIGADSTGTVIDVMLTRCTAPLLIIRRPDQTFSTALNEVSLIVSAECDAESLAAAWALGLAAEGGSISLDVVAEKEQLENLQKVLEVIAPGTEVKPEDLSQALADSHTSLHAGLQKASYDAGISYKLVPKAAETAPPLLSEESQPQLIVMPNEVDDTFVHGFVHDRIRRSPHPVLVVSTHVPKQANDA